MSNVPNHFAAFFALTPQKKSKINLLLAIRRRRAPAPQGKFKCPGKMRKRENSAAIFIYKRQRYGIIGEKKAEALTGNSAGRMTEMKKIKLGVLGGYRGKSMMEYAVRSDDCTLTAVCDYSKAVLDDCARFFEERQYPVALCSDFESFLSCDMDAVVLANYANEHAPYAVRCLKRGLHVFSEVLPVATLKEAAELCDAVEESGKVYFYAENYCYFEAVREMRRLMQSGALGEFQYGEGEYLHDCEPGWASLTYGDRRHWRNTMDAFYYCTHSFGPLRHVSGLRPVKVSGFEAPYSEKTNRMGCAAAPFAVEMVTLENGALVKSIHGIAPSRNSVWYCVYGSKGIAESGREGISAGTRVLSASLDGVNEGKYRTYEPADALTERAKNFGHEGGDLFVMYHFIRAINGLPNDGIDVYEALDMYFVGHFAHISSLRGGAPVEIPDFRDRSVRDRYRNDDASVMRPDNDFSVNPPSCHPTPAYPDSLYRKLRQDYLKNLGK